MKNILAIVPFLGLVACGDIASTDPSAFSTTKNGNQITGTYNPEGWTAERIRTFTRHECASGEIANYSETPQSNGLIAFVIDCA